MMSPGSIHNDLNPRRGIWQRSCRKDDINFMTFLLWPEGWLLHNKNGHQSSLDVSRIGSNGPLCYHLSLLQIRSLGPPLTWVGKFSHRVYKEGTIHFLLWHDWHQVHHVHQSNLMLDQSRDHCFQGLTARKISTRISAVPSHFCKFSLPRMKDNFLALRKWLEGNGCGEAAIFTHL